MESADGRHLTMKQVNLTPDDFPDKCLLPGFEGGSVYTAQRAGRYYIIDLPPLIRHA